MCGVWLHDGGTRSAQDRAYDEPNTINREVREPDTCQQAFVIDYLAFSGSYGFVDQSGAAQR
jgi:hypothetical protein